MNGASKALVNLPRVSVVIVCYEMASQIENTLRSLLPPYQREITLSDFEIVVIDNGSAKPLEERLQKLSPNLRYIYIPPGEANPNPAIALNRGVAMAQAPLLCLMIDGARMVTPGVLSWGLRLMEKNARALVEVRGWHLGPKFQPESIMEGYDENVEKALLEKVRWQENGYRLFEIAAASAQTRAGLSSPTGESNCVFLAREIFSEIGGFDERVRSAGGGFVNLDFFARAVGAVDTVFSLLGEGTFHQVHGGAATGLTAPVLAEAVERWRAESGELGQVVMPDYKFILAGHLPPECAAWLGRQAAASAGNTGASFPIEKPAAECPAAAPCARGDAYRLSGDLEGAELEYRLALTFDADSVEAHLGLSELRMPGENYLGWLERLQAALLPESYLEIGVARGKTLALAKPPTCAIGVDPKPMISVPLETETHIFCEPSDQFFVQKKLKPLLNGRPLSLVFIDGLHVFQQSLKDFINVETFCGPESIVLLHDTVPLDEPTQRPQRQGKFYTGDVWKTVLCLKHYRPELDIFTIATPWTGLTVVTGLDPASRVLENCYDEAWKRFVDVPFAEFEPRLSDALNLVPNNWEDVRRRLEAKGILQAAKIDRRDSLDPCEGKV